MAEMECGENGGLDGIEFRAGAMLPNLGDLDDLPLVAPVKELVVAWPSTGGGRVGGRAGRAGRAGGQGGEGGRTGAGDQLVNTARPGPEQKRRWRAGRRPWERWESGCSSRAGESGQDEQHGSDGEGGGGRDTVVAVRRGAPDTESARTRTGGRSVRVCAGVGTAGDACETGVERR